MKCKEFANKMASEIIHNNKDSKEAFLTGETKLKLTKDELEKKMLKLKNGKSYLGVLKAEHRILEGQGAILAGMVDGEIVFAISDWDSFISRIDAFHIACGPY